MPTRRAIVAVVIAGGLAGCLGDGDDASGNGDDGDGADYTGPMVGETELRHNYPVVLEDPDSGDRVVEIHYHQTGAGEWHFQPLTLAVGETRELVILLYDSDAERLPIGGGEGYDFAPTGVDEEIVTLSIGGERVTFEGVAAGTTEVAFVVTGPADGSWTTPALGVVVED